MKINNQDLYTHDVNKRCDNLTVKLHSLSITKDINDFFEKSLDFLSSFKSIIDNNEQIRDKLKNNEYIKYVIRLRNYQQHHEFKYKETIEANSYTVIGNNAIVMDSQSSIVVKNLICDGQIASNVNISAGRVLNMDGEDNLGRKFIISRPFNFSYIYKKACYNGISPVGYTFYEILLEATKILINEMKKHK